MIEEMQGTGPSALLNTAATHPERARGRNVLHMKHNNDRMAGSVPVWEREKTVQENVAADLTRAVEGTAPGTFDTALAYAENSAAEADGGPDPEEFGFGDLLDMVNPLQHIPVVNHLYRNITGDEIKPVSQIMGGALYGGAAGAAGNLVSFIVEYETGKDITGNVLAIATGYNSPSAARPSDQPERLLNSAVHDVENAAFQELPESVLGFTNMRTMRTVETVEVARVPVANGRTAGSMPRRPG